MRPSARRRRFETLTKKRLTSAKQVADKAGTSDQTVLRVLDGRSPVTTPKGRAVATEIARALGVRPDEAFPELATSKPRAARRDKAA